MQMKGRRPGQAWPLGVAARPGSGAGTRTLLLGDAEGRAVTRSLMRAVIGAAWEWRAIGSWGLVATETVSRAELGTVTVAEVQRWTACEAEWQWMSTREHPESKIRQMRRVWGR